ncbi:hybrid sensor histidine kinase/response regulator [Puniceicoccales bacterium CK1056]|uniref:histidine kinase n=1 Tax=Oceanipulchritudo coccoides TaxID=2706888 RepID=A0A6B2M2H9_9BACT|nr:response regulator [Oceanipulchritudo coccoides]NDV62005.1 hybrid sensor histidine kinase/response regulator [Oceanipulchritudo coccoides]
MSRSKILVVDDQILNIRLIERKLEMIDMDVVSCTNGPEAIRLATQERPDVILLDIMMTGMNGIEVCQALKKAEETREIPVIFLTALGTREQKVHGLEAGAADYVTKPFDLDETVARIRTQLRIVEEHRENIKLTRQLEQSRRQSAIMHLTEGIAHNINNLLGVMLGYVNLLQMNSGKPDRVLNACGKLEHAIQRVTRIVQQLQVIGQFKSLQKQPTELARILKGAVARFHGSSNTSTKVDVRSDFEDDMEFFTNRELMEVCIERLLQNAYESYFANDADTNPKIGEIILESKEVEFEGAPHVQVRVMDRGKGIDEKIRDSIFDPFVSSSSVIGKGMGLTIARHSVSCLGGTIEVIDREDGGTQAVALFPLEHGPGGENEA